MDKNVIGAIRSGRLGRIALAYVEWAGGHYLEIAVEDNRLKRVDEAALLEELRGHLPEFQNQHDQLEALNSAFQPAFEQIHRRCCDRDLGINRFSRPPAEWYQN